MFYKKCRHVCWCTGQNSDRLALRTSDHLCCHSFADENGHQSTGPGETLIQTQGPRISPQQRPSWRDKERAVPASSPCDVPSWPLLGTSWRHPVPLLPSWHDALRAAVMAGKSAPAQRAALQAAGCGSSCLSPASLPTQVGQEGAMATSGPSARPLCPVWTTPAHLICTLEGLVQIEQVWWGFLSSLPGGASGNEPACQCRNVKRRGFNPWVRKIPWRRNWQPTPVFLPGKSHGQRSLGLKRIRYDRAHIHLQMSKLRL